MAQASRRQSNWPRFGSVLMIAAMLTAGCSSPAPSNPIGSGGALFVEGTATYNITKGDDHVGTLSWSSSLTGESLVVEADVSLRVPSFGGGSSGYESEFSAVYDLATGALLSLQTNDWTWWPWNEHQTWQAPVGLWAYGGRHTLERGIIPLSPILAAWNTAGTSASLHEVLGVTGSWRQGPEWHLETRGTCRVDCLGIEKDAPIWLNATGTDSIFPATYSWVSGHAYWHGAYTFTRVALDVKDTRAIYASGAQISPRPPVDALACGLSLCEGQDWDPRFSIQDGLAALESSPEWQDWASAHPDNWPLFVSVGRSRAGVLTTELASLTRYSFAFAADDTAAHYYHLWQPGPPAEVGGPTFIQDHWDLPAIEDPEQFRRDQWRAPPIDVLEAQAALVVPDGIRLTMVTLFYDSSKRVAEPDDQVQMEVLYRDDQQVGYGVRLIPAFAHVAEVYAL